MRFVNGLSHGARLLKATRVNTAQICVHGNLQFSQKMDQPRSGALIA
jgi:hypothetical protein